MSNDVESIVRGLSKAQRTTVMRLGGDSWRACGRGNSSAFYLCWRGICEGRWDRRFAPARKQYRLTPLGLSVRQHLLSEAGEEG